MTDMDIANSAAKQKGEEWCGEDESEEEALYYDVLTLY
jgi:hypothetical protein